MKHSFAHLDAHQVCSNALVIRGRLPSALDVLIQADEAAKHNKTRSSGGELEKCSKEG